MQFNEFKRVVTCFADDVDDVDATRSELSIQIRDEMITARLLQRPDGVLVEEHDVRLPAKTWIVKRLARLPMLADRICSYVSPPEHFVSPSGRLLDQLDTDPFGEDVPQPEAAQAMTAMLDRHPAGTTSVVYLTSDAGGGKTSLINHLAVKQAEAYKAKRSDWLLVPFALGGHSFLRLDDVVVSELVNKLRFQILYFDAFLELVRLGVLVPAFDGFEEMIVEPSSGEALSELGSLVGSLRSAGTLVVAARKAYFDYLTFGAQARLFDTIGSDGDVAFGRVSLNRWGRDTFEQYAGKRGIPNSKHLYSEVSGRLGVDHPVLTRAVLVKRLVDIAEEEGGLLELLDHLGLDRHDVFHEFVDSIVKREARAKWADNSGEPGRALLTTDEHHALLAMVAQEMWLSSTGALGIDVVALLVEMFADARKKGPAVERQIRERIRQHALLVLTQAGRKVGKTGQVSDEHARQALRQRGRTLLAFDHEDFRVFYLGQALGRALVESDVHAVRSILETAALPTLAVEEASSFVQGLGGDAGRETLGLLQALADEVLPESFVRENCGLVALALIDRGNAAHEIREMSFPAGALCNRKLTNAKVSGSYFRGTGLTETGLSGCRFVNCHFERLEIDGTQKVKDASFDSDCRIDALVHVDSEGDQSIRYDPDRIRRDLLQAGFEIPSESPSKPGTSSGEDTDEDLILAQRFLRQYLRATALNESTLRRRLGVRANHFFDVLLPQLEHAGVVQSVPGQRSGTQRRMRLVAPMTQIEEAMSASRGDFGSFVHEVRRRAA